MIQEALASIPCLRAARDYAGLLHDRGRTVAEMVTVMAERARLTREHRLGRGYLLAYSPPGCHPQLDSGLSLLDGTPWWRGHVALAAAQYEGFSGGVGGTRPWRSGTRRTAGVPRDDWAVRLVGQRHRVAAAQALYASASLHVACACARATGIHREQRAEYALGLAVGVYQQLARARADRDDKEAVRTITVDPHHLKHADVEFTPEPPPAGRWYRHGWAPRASWQQYEVPPRRAMVAWEEAPKAFDARRAQADDQSALQRGLRAANALELGKRARGIYPPAAPTRPPAGDLDYLLRSFVAGRQ